MEIALHIGAHKTASTYIQNTLELNMQLLSRNNINYIPLKEMRRSITSKIKFGKINTMMFSKLLKANTDSIRLILSDENLIGAPGDLIKQGTIYEKSRSRLSNLCNALGDEDFFVYLSVRNYETFIPSLYLELLRHHSFFSFTEFTRKFNIFDISWYKIVRSLCIKFRQENITLWDFAEFRNIEDEVFSSLIGSQLPIVKLTDPVRPSLSGKAVAALGALHAVLSDDEIRPFVRPISQAFPKGAKYPAFMPFPEDTAMKLRAHFAADMARIRADFPQINWLGPQDV
jgi:hypothetical protein